MIYRKLDDGRLIIKLAKKVDQQLFLKVCGTKNKTYGEEFALNIYRSVFLDADDILKEQQDYYSTEYDSLGKYLFWRYHVPGDVINEVTGKPDSGYLVIIKDYPWEYDEDDLFSDVVKQILESLEEAK